MKRGGVTPKTLPTGWVFFDRPAAMALPFAGSDREAYVLRGNKVGSWTMEGLLGTIPVSSKGWSDLAEIRSTGVQWVHSK